MTVPWRAGRTFLIAEAGVNHNGDLDRAAAMVELAAEAGADAVKFQTFRAEALVTARAAMAEYQQRNVGADGSQLDMLRELELSDDAHLMLKRRAEELGLLFFSTAFDDASIDFLASLDQPLWKIPSGEITNYPYLVRIAGMNKPTILSTGMATLAEVAQAVELLEEHGLERDRLCILHCNTEYPTPLEDVNLRAMESLGAAFGCAYGYSDHTDGVIVSIVATARGARVIEKHFTLNKSLPGPDHAASMAPDELREWIAVVRQTEAAMGSHLKRPSPSEAKNRLLGRKIIVAATPVPAGERFSEANLTVKRAGQAGITPMRWPDVIGRIARRSFEADEPIQL
jgi:N,N'-diacetyllegionaminate synthase